MHTYRRQPVTVWGLDGDDSVAERQNSEEFADVLVASGNQFMQLFIGEDVAVQICHEIVVLLMTTDRQPTNAT